MPCLLADAVSIAKWLGALSGWEAALVSIGGFVTTLVGVVWPVVRAVRKQRKLDMEMVGQPVTTPPPVDSTDRIVKLEVALARSEWDLDTCRKRVGELEKTVRDIGADHARTAQSLAGERYARERAESERDKALAELAAAEERALAIAAELAELKRAMGGGHTTLAVVTPLRPPRRDR